MNFNEIKRKIKNLEIQGANRVALAGILALTKKNRPNEILKLRPTEPALRNLVRFVTKDPKKNFPVAVHYMKEMKKRIAINGAKLIRNNSKIFTHCHSGSVIAVLKEVKKKNITVYCTESRPRFQGRMTAKELTNFGIKTIHFVDSAAETYLKECDLVLLGADSVEGAVRKVVFNKIGSMNIAMIAHYYRKPVYHVTSLLKYDYDRKTEMEFRDIKEIWERPPKKVKIMNPAFDAVPFKFIKGIVCEQGIFKPKKYAKRARKLIKNEAYLL
ncbi:translation initiation factor eIF-2B [Candidatus Woesearchaeota archaeon]|uniref:R15P Isomerase n=1 Tax=uncultured Candidatus Woesearchaeota archaeon TaxID=2014372 RepID=A0A447IUD1_9ARCH|nr:translation initiation factor eIF-2B [Candidatus Woesearchaeota archaeon]VDS11097.1 R15P Isomerase [uncultured Candidatus Woesearchaeota archaeon]VDS11101.1 R15P Isomerase [uncultured Candidatus Woesearchaeota archaeon]VDS11108.1 R15P Isomerase [uncultured Candidatus Woesearchaeota archaeon]